MKLKHFLVIGFLAIFFASCSSDKLSLKDMTDRFIKDSVLINFNDPKSFEIVSIKYDSISNHLVEMQKKGNYLEELQIYNTKLSKNRLQMLSDELESTGTAIDKEIMDAGKLIDSNIKKTISIINESIDLCDNKLQITDSLHHINIEVSYRAKNKMGALVLDNMNLFYYPNSKIFEVINLQSNQ